MFIKQIHSMADTTTQLFGMTFGMVTIVGIVRAIEHSSTKVTYTLEDHTGRIDAHLWLEEGDSMTAPMIVLNTYARVFGSLRAQGGSQTIMLFKIVPIESANEVTTHNLECLFTRYKAEDLANNGVRPATTTTTTNNNNGSQANGDQNNENPGGYGLQGNEEKIFRAVKDYKAGDQGISIKELQQQFPTISSNEIQYVLVHTTLVVHITHHRLMMICFFLLFYFQTNYRIPVI